MSKRAELIAKYADDLKTKCNISPDMDLLAKVTIGCGPAIYNSDASTVAGSDASELETIKKNFLIKKHKYRAVVYYMLTKHFGKEAIYSK